MLRSDSELGRAGPSHDSPGRTLYPALPTFVKGCSVSDYNQNAGGTARFTCNGCNREFELTYEPKAKVKPSLTRGIEPADVTFCPYCGLAGHLTANEFASPDAE